MPETMETTIYKFEELSPRAKDRARDWYREGETFSDYVDYDDFQTIADILGISFDIKQVTLMGGGTRDEPRIFWSGFRQQGDGLCFEGSYSYKRYTPQQILDHANDDVLASIASDLFVLQYMYGKRLAARVTHSGRYYHEHSVTIDVTDSETGDNDGVVDIKAEEELSEILRRLMRWMYRQLEQEYEWRNADEQVDESIIVNDYTFTEDGKRAG